MGTDQITLTIDSLHSALNQVDARLAAINDALISQNNNSFLGVSWDILLPALISILVFVLGYIISNLLERRKIQKNRILVRDTIITWADSNFETLEKYVQSIKNLAERIGKSDDYGPETFAIQHITIDVLTQFSIDRLTDALVSGLPGKMDRKVKGAQLNAYLTSVSYLVITQKVVMEQYEEYRLKATDLSYQWDAKWKAFQQNFDMNTMRHLTMQNSPEKQFYSDLFQIIQSCDKDISKYSSGKILILALMRAFDSNHFWSKEILETNYVFKNLYAIMSQIEDLKQYQQLFLDDVEKIEKGIEKFRGVIDFYRGHKMKYWA